MTPPDQPEPSTSSTESRSKASELNDLLQIISGTSSAIETVSRENDGSKKYLKLLRESIKRAEKLAAEIAEESRDSLKNSPASSEAGTINESKTPEESAQKQTILVIDDEHPTRTLVQRILEETGYRVVPAQSGFEGLDLFRRSPGGFDLVLLDLTMPFMDGEETFVRLREIQPDIGVVLCTGFIHQETLSRLMSIGLAGFLRKPIAPDEIVGTVRATLENVKYSGAGLNTAAALPVL